MKSRVIVVGLVEKDGKFLVGRKPPGVGPYPDTWHIPGGGMNLGEESIEEALRREMREETTLEITDITPVGFDEDKSLDKKGEPVHYIFLKFKAKYLSGEAKAGDDLKTLKWVSKDELLRLDVNEPTQKFLKQAGIE